MGPSGPLRSLKKNLKSHIKNQVNFAYKTYLSTGQKIVVARNPGFFPNGQIPKPLEKAGFLSIPEYRTKNCGGKKPGFFPERADSQTIRKSRVSFFSLGWKFSFPQFFFESVTYL